MNIKPLIPTYVNIARKNQVDDRTVVKEYFNKDKVRELEANYQEAIEEFKRLVEYNIFVAIQEGSNEKVEQDIFKKQITIIEKATGKSWKEIKELSE